MTKKKTPGGGSGSGGKKPPSKPKATAAGGDKGVPKRKLLSRNTEKLICDLSETEIAQRRAEVTRKVGVLAEHNTYMKKESARLGAMKKELEASITSLSASADSGRTEREVAVEDYADYAESVVKTIRADTGEVVRERPLRPEERQDALPLRGIPGGKVTHLKAAEKGAKGGDKANASGSANGAPPCPYAEDGVPCTLADGHDGEHDMKGTGSKTDGAGDKAADKGGSDSSKPEQDDPNY